MFETNQFRARWVARHISGCLCMGHSFIAGARPPTEAARMHSAAGAEYDRSAALVFPWSAPSNAGGSESAVDLLRLYFMGWPFALPPRVPAGPWQAWP